MFIDIALLQCQKGIRTMGMPIHLHPFGTELPLGPPVSCSINMAWVPHWRWHCNCRCIFHRSWLHTGIHSVSQKTIIQNYTNYYLPTSECNNLNFLCRRTKCSSLAFTQILRVMDRKQIFIFRNLEILFKKKRSFSFRKPKTKIVYIRDY